ncbi:DUF6600 domain-containing protein [Massilia endophytica]|uniref:DUF6600 domain-containing protein n=1 Tax=Massilia endophytica TaxID=2899220 RepID=UPI001E5FCC05|nr:DUF6600 domain-containing protein [Massilia endophytica]UGQ46444.1 hypothetical protein LSQ66_22200 [Massilia endophytica]
MSRKAVHFVLLLALVAVSSFALADPPSRVGRISAVEGKVTLQTDGDEDTGPLLNWPVTSSNHLTTARGARTEFRVGSAAIWLDGDSDLEVVELDDDSLRLRLNYGSASVRLRAPEMLGEFELTTPQARIVMTEPGMLRVDAERAVDTTSVSVFFGAAQVDGAGTLLNLRAGKRGEVRGDDVFTALARADGFDEWVQGRDKRTDAAIATRYIPDEVTGYEELDRYGSWTVNEEYGPLWTPRLLAADWAPYRDGRWTWISPWGWTWVDNAPWGYAPSHYGRWVVVNRRWYWSPGRFVGRPVWAPALVGWVGGANWSISFGSRHSGPGIGWYPLTPRDRFVPTYRVSPDHEHRLGWTYRGNERWRDRNHDGRRDGVTVLPHDRFDRRHTVQVDRAQRVTVAPNALVTAPVATPPVPAGIDRNRDGVPDRFQRDRNHDGIPDRIVGTPRDRNGDGIPDRNPISTRDRNGDGVPDRNVITTRDRNGDGIRDRSMAVPPSRDLNGDGVPDRSRFDRNGDGVRDAGDWRHSGPRTNPVQPLQTNPVAPQVQSQAPAPVPQPGILQARPAIQEGADRRQQMEERRQHMLEERRQRVEERMAQRPQIQPQPQQPQAQMQPQPQPAPAPFQRAQPPQAVQPQAAPPAQQDVRERRERRGVSKNGERDRE